MSANVCIHVEKIGKQPDVRINRHSTKSSMSPSCYWVKHASMKQVAIYHEILTWLIYSFYWFMKNGKLKDNLRKESYVSCPMYISLEQIFNYFMFSREWPSYLHILRHYEIEKLCHKTFEYFLLFNLSLCPSLYRLQNAIWDSDTWAVTA